MATFKDLEDLMKRLLALDPPGVAVSVARHGDVLYEGYFGTTDLAGTRPIAPDTLYRLYSMTKPIAALCGMHWGEKAARSGSTWAQCRKQPRRWFSVKQALM